MADALLETGRAAAMFLAALEFSRVQFYDGNNIVCLNSSFNNTSHIIFQGWNGSNPSATLIAIDGADIAYFHLGTIGTSWVEVRNNGFCNGAGHAELTGYGLAGRTVNVYDGGSDTAPYDGHTIIPHSGYAVCAARRKGAGSQDWLPFGAGNATALTIAACRAATGVNDGYTDLGGALPQIQLTIRSVDADE